MVAVVSCILGVDFVNGLRDLALNKMADKTFILVLCDVPLRTFPASACCLDFPYVSPLLGLPWELVFAVPEWYLSVTAEQKLYPCVFLARMGY